VTVTVEATLQWAWLHDRLTQAGFPVRVAHPQQVKLISHARCKTDPNTRRTPTVYLGKPQGGKTRAGRARDPEET